MEYTTKQIEQVCSELSGDLQSDIGFVRHAPLIDHRSYVGHRGVITIDRQGHATKTICHAVKTRDTLDGQMWDVENENVISRYLMTNKMMG